MVIGCGYSDPPPVPIRPTCSNMAVYLIANLMSLQNDAQVDVLCDFICYPLLIHLPGSRQMYLVMERVG